MEKWTRRRFFQSTLAGTLAVSAGKFFGGAAGAKASCVAQSAGASTLAGQGKRPLII
jgi:hypothetical protein